MLNHQFRGHLGDLAAAFFMVDDLWHVASLGFAVLDLVLCSATVVVEHILLSTKA
jgi:hypothetical protein